MPAPRVLPPHWFQMLLALADEDRHGIGIMEEVLERTDGAMRLWPAMLYRNLQRLLDAGLIAELPSPDAPQAGRPRYFRLTTAGRRACKAEAERMAGFVAAARVKRILDRR